MANYLRRLCGVLAPIPQPLGGRNFIGLLSTQSVFRKQSLKTDAPLSRRLVSNQRQKVKACFGCWSKDATAAYRDRVAFFCINTVRPRAKCYHF
jgi:hypothetical protein